MSTHHVLIPVDAGHEQRTQSAVEQAVQLNPGETTVVHLLQVQPPLSRHVASVFHPSELHQLQLDWGQEALASARRLLERAGVPFDCTVKIGHSAPTIASTARELGCDRIVFGTEKPGLGDRLFGTLAQQVRQLLQAQGDPVVMGS